MTTNDEEPKPLTLAELRTAIAEADAAQVRTLARAVTDRPLAANGLASYRYRGRYGWVMIGAKDDSDALREAGRSVSGAVTLDRLEVWTGERYEPASQAIRDALRNVAKLRAEATIEGAKDALKKLGE